MTIDQVNSKLNKMVKVYFKPYDQRVPMIGKFVSTKDSEELSSKGMARFVNMGKISDFERLVSEGKSANYFAKIYVVADFTQIVEIKPGVNNGI